MKVKPAKWDRMGLAVGFTKQQFDSANLGAYQTMTKDGLNFYFTRDSKEKTEYFGRVEYPEKVIVDLPSLSKENLTLGK